jgi:CO/xanthine dehydrogenase FAD-binding subunit
VKPAPFQYHRAADQDDAVQLLDRYGDEGRVLAGGQSLVPMMNFRLARPKHVVDIMHVPSLSFIRVERQWLMIGAATRQWRVERSPLVARGWPLLHRALAYVGHPQIRARGTFGGSVAHADPAAELPVALAALEARFRVRSTRGTRVIPWRDFFQAEFVTACAADEVLERIEVPPPRPRTGASFREYAARHGDFAAAGVATTISLDDGGLCTDAAVALLACGPTPLRSAAAERFLVGRQVTPSLAAEAAEAAAASLEIREQTSMPAEYRRHLMLSLVREAVLEASERATHAANNGHMP